MTRDANGPAVRNGGRRGGGLAGGRVPRCRRLAASLAAALVLQGATGGSGTLAQDAAPPTAAPLPSMAAPAGPSPAPAPDTAMRIALLPLEDKSDAAAPVTEIREALRSGLRARRIALLDDEVLESFMRKHRVRYIGGLARELGQSLRRETGALAVLVSSVDLYAEKDPPKLALTCRLISAGDETRILWMDTADLAGDEAPGFLGLGRVDDPRTVRDKVIDRLAGSLALHLGGAAGPRKAGPPWGGGPRRFRPRTAYRSPDAPPEGTGPLRVAVLPFSDESATRHAGEILSLQILGCLVNAGGVEVLEPGVVREVLLSSRLIQEEGPSIPQADLLRALLEVDVVLFGEVTEYLEPGAGAAEPEIDFSVRAIDTARRQVIWSSVSHGRGDDGVFFFGLGRVPTAHALASRMARALIGGLLPAVERAT